MRTCTAGIPTSCLRAAPGISYCAGIAIQILAIRVLPMVCLCLPEELFISDLKVARVSPGYYISATCITVGISTIRRIVTIVPKVGPVALKAISRGAE